MSAPYFTGSVILDPEHATDGWSIRHQCAVTDANGPAKPQGILFIGPIMVSTSSHAVVQALIDQLEALASDLLKAADLIDSGATTVGPSELHTKHAAYVAQLDHDLADERAMAQAFPAHTRAVRFGGPGACLPHCVRCGIDKRAEQGAKS